VFEASSEVAIPEPRLSMSSGIALLRFNRSLRKQYPWLGASADYLVFDMSKRQIASHNGNEGWEGMMRPEIKHVGISRDEKC
jgi:hypothetical protein